MDSFVKWSFLALFHLSGAHDLPISFSVVDSPFLQNTYACLSDIT